MNRIIGLLVTLIFGVICLYLSRFWLLTLWSRSDLGGWLPPRGGLVSTWLRDLGGRDLASLELLVWVIGFFLLLTLLDKLLTKFFGS